jgi:hypothetical protein
LAGGYLHLTDITITRWSGSATCPPGAVPALTP